MMILLWESSSSRLTIANAGTEPPLICRDGEITKPHVEGIPIGLLDDRSYDETVFEAKTGDVLLFYSDGVEDQLNARGEDFGRGRLARALRRHCGLAPQLLVDEIFSELDVYMDGTPITDDQTIIAVRVA